MKGSLPILKPPVQYSPPIDLLTSLLCSEDRCYYDLINNFIEITYIRNSPIGWVEFWGFNDFRNFSSLDMSVIPRDYINQNNLFDIIEDLINCGYYLMLNVNTQFIPCYNRKMPLYHELCIWGFDSERKTVNIQDYFDTLYWSNNTCTYQEITDAFINYPFSDYIHGILAIRISKSQSSQFYPQNISSRILLTLESQPGIIYSENKLYGISFFTEVRRVLTENNLFLRYFNFMYAHVFFMCLRTGYLQKIKRNDSIQLIFRTTKELFTKIKQIRLFVLYEIERKKNNKNYTIRFDRILNLVGQFEKEYIDHLKAILNYINLYILN